MPAPPAVYLAWLVGGVAAAGWLSAAFAESGDEAAWVGWSLGGALAALVVGGMVLIYKVALRQRFIYVCETQALDYLQAARTSHDGSLDRVRRLEECLARTGAYRSARTVGAARREFEAESRRARPRASSAPSTS